MPICCRCRTVVVEAFAPSQHAKTYAWCRECFAADYLARSGGWVVDECAWCGCDYACTARGSERMMFCSRRCKDAARHMSDQEERLAAKAAAPSRSCPQCGLALAAVHRTDAVYCSERCNSAAHNATRKASAKIGARAQRIDRAYIIERDRSRCHLCGKRCKPGEIQLDHLIPLSRGGTHTAENLRVACAHCNLSKRADARGEQLLLVG